MWNYRRPLLPPDVLSYDNVFQAIEAVIPNDLLWDLEINKCTEANYCHVVILKVFDSLRDSRPDYRETLRESLRIVPSIYHVSPAGTKCLDKYELILTFHLSIVR